MTDVSVQSSVPLPEHPGRAKRRYPWHKLDIGDSFLHPGNRNAATAAMWYAAKKTGHKYASRADGEGYRIWRVE